MSSRVLLRFFSISFFLTTCIAYTAEVGEGTSTSASAIDNMQDNVPQQDNVQLAELISSDFLPIALPPAQEGDELHNISLETWDHLVPLREKAFDRINILLKVATCDVENNQQRIENFYSNLERNGFGSLAQALVLIQELNQKLPSISTQDQLLHEINVVQAIFKKNKLDVFIPYIRPFLGVQPEAMPFIAARSILAGNFELLRDIPAYQHAKQHYPEHFGQTHHADHYRELEERVPSLKNDDKAQTSRYYEGILQRTLAVYHALLETHAPIANTLALRRYKLGMLATGTAAAGLLLYNNWETISSYAEAFAKKISNVTKQRKRRRLHDE